MPEPSTLPGSPLVIVGVSGSGTRAFARLVEASGRHMGALQNTSNDALTLFPLAEKWCEPVYRAWQTDGIRPEDQAEFEVELAKSLVLHRQGVPENIPWGWKQPRSIHLLPAIAAAHRNEVLVLHVIRDGRDLALGEPTHHRMTGSYTVPEGMRSEPVPVQLAQIWASTNSRAADFGERILSDRYLRVSLEKLCTHPRETVDRILEFGGGSISSEQVDQIVEPPESIGRWHDAHPSMINAIEHVAGPALRRFGYSH